MTKRGTLDTRIVTPTRVFLCALWVTGAATAWAQDGRTNDPPEAQPAGGVIYPTGGGGLMTEPELLTSAIDFVSDRMNGTGKPKQGFYLETSNLITGAGFVSLGPGYRQQLFGGRAYVDASAAVSWHLYKMGQVRFEVPDLADRRLRFGAQLMWQDYTQVSYFGIGDDSLEENESQYRMTGADIVGDLTYRLRPSLAIGGEIGWLRAPDIRNPGGTFRPDLPPTTEQFPDDPGVGLAQQPAFLHAEISLTADTRDYRSHPTAGHLYRAAWIHYTDRGAGTFSFREYEGEALQMLRIAGPTWILALHGWTVLSDVPAGHDVPFYLLPTVGGSNTIRSYSNFRFHDRHMATATVESRWALFTHVDVAAFVDGGGVAARLADLTLDKTAVGVGARLHSGRATFARFDVAYGAEGWRFVMRTSDPLRLSRVTRRVAALPFVP